MKTENFKTYYEVPTSKNDKILGEIWFEIQRIKSRRFDKIENVVLSVDRAKDMMHRSIFNPVSDKLTVFGIPVIRCIDLGDNEFKIITKL